MDTCIDSNTQAVVRRCMRRVRHWRAPPNWSASDWIREATAQATLAALSLHHPGARAGTSVDSDDDGTARPSDGRVLGSVLTRYRQEWSYARHCSRQLVYESPEARRDDEEGEELLSRLKTIMKTLPER